MVKFDKCETIEAEMAGKREDGSETKTPTEKNEVGDEKDLVSGLNIRQIEEILSIYTGH